MAVAAPLPERKVTVVLVVVEVGTVDMPPPALPPRATTWPRRVDFIRVLSVMLFPVTSRCRA